MKKTLLYTIWASIALMTVSCVEPLSNELPSNGSGKASLKLSVNCLMPSTKATAAGVDTLNENKISTLDWFVFTAAGDNATAIEHGRKTYTDKDNVTEAFTVETINMEPYVDATSKTVSGRVYIVANLPVEYTHEDDGIHYTSGSTSSTIGTKLGDLKKLEVVTTFDVLGPDGKTKKQNAFVMASEVATFALDDDNRQQEVVAQLSRVASKITLDLSVVSAIDEVVARLAGRDTLYEEYIKTWYPDVDHIQVYLSYANGRTTIDRTLFDGDPYDYDDETFFTYERGGFTPKIESSGTGWSVTGSPFYSYPMKWTLVAEHAPFIKIILPWRSYVETPTYETYPYILHEVDPESGLPTTRDGNKLQSATRLHINDHSAAAEEFFYKISIPAENNKLKSNTWYDIALDVAILGGRSDELIMEVAGKYYVVDWSDPDFTAGGSLVQGSYLKLGSDTYYIYGEDAITIPVLSSHDVTTTVTRARYTDFSGNTPTGANIPSGSYSTRNFGRDSFKLTHVLNRNITSTGLDCSVDTFYVRVSNDAGLSENITIIQQPPLYITSEASNKYVFINANSNHANSGWTSGNYKKIYDDGGSHLVPASYKPTVGTNNSYSTTNGPTIVFTNVENQGGSTNRRKLMGTDSTHPGTITITAPTGGTITGITIGYYNNQNSQPVTYNPAATGSTKTRWEGSASTVIVTMPYGTNRNAVNAITVEYTAVSTAVEKLGAMARYSLVISENLSNYNIYTVTVSDLSSNTYGWYISDPRKTTGEDHLNLKGGSSTGTALTNYYASDPQKSNAISPLFKIASSSGASYYGGDLDESRMTYEQAVRRCASYQENGYPAGRWRIPTDAEIRFCIELSNRSKIPSLFSGTYWAASGKKLNNNGAETTTNNGASVRCVYDAWYWGNKPVDAYKQTWSGWQN